MARKKKSEEEIEDQKEQEQEDDDKEEDEQEEKEEKQSKEDAPTWAKSILSSLENLSKNLQGEPESKNKTTQELEVPKIPKPKNEEKKEEELKESQSLIPEKKQKSFLDWFL